MGTRLVCRGVFVFATAWITVAGSDSPRAAAEPCRLPMPRGITLANCPAHTDWTCAHFVSLGHPHFSVVTMVKEATAAGVTPAKDRGAALVDAPVGTGAEKFTERTVARKVYGTGWDGTVVIRSDQQRGNEVMTEK